MLHRVVEGLDSEQPVPCQSVWTQRGEILARTTFLVLQKQYEPGEIHNQDTPFEMAFMTNKHLLNLEEALAVRGPWAVNDLPKAACAAISKSGAR